MKVLVPVYPCTNVGYPAKVTPGGLEVMIEKIIDSLVRLGHEVTLITPEGFEVHTDDVKQIIGNFKCADDRGNVTDWKGYTLTLFEALETEEYDAAIINNLTLYMGNLWKHKELRQAMINRFKALCPKIRAIYHMYDNLVDGPLYCRRQIQVLMQIAESGGRSFTVSSTLASYLSGKYPEGIYGENLHNVDLLTRNLDYSNLEKFNVQTFLEPVCEISSDGSFIFIGRGAAEKNLRLAIESFLESGHSGKLKIFTNPPQVAKFKEKRFTNESVKYFQETFDKYKDNPNLQWSLCAPREDVLKALAESSVLLFPSKKESFGLVPFEAACSGLNLVYHNANAQCYEDTDIYCERCKVDEFAEAIRQIEIPTTAQKKARIERMRKAYSQEKFDQQVEDLLKPPAAG